MILLIDNYDSFTHNLVHLIGGLGETVMVKRNDAISIAEALSAEFSGIIISPGPRTPNEAGICLDLVTAAASRKKPVFGVCLGMQSIAQAFGGQIKSSRKLMHGKTCAIVHQGDGIFHGVPSPFTATRYHSLAVTQNSLPDGLAITATAEDDGEAMALAHNTLPIAGVQFHPESIASEHGAAILSNFLTQMRK